MGQTMRAIGFHEHGSIDNLDLLEVPRPEPEPGEVLVEVAAASLNHQDVIAVRELDMYVPSYPFWGGGDFTGHIADLGSGVTEWDIGDRVVVNPALWCDQCERCLEGEVSMCLNYAVYGEHRHGGFAEFVTVPSKNLAPVPDDFDLVSAAAVPMAAGTAWRALVETASVKPYEEVLIVGASGGVGTYAVQIATEVLNVKSLYATTSSADKAAYLADLGVDHVIDYTTEPFDERIWALTDGRGVDVVYNNVGGSTWVPGLRSLTNGGRLVVSGATAGPNPETEIRLLFVRQLRVLGSTTFNRAQFSRMLDAVWSGSIRPNIQEIYAFDEYETAFQKMTNRELVGKIVLTPS